MNRTIAISLLLLPLSVGSAQQPKVQTIHQWLSPSRQYLVRIQGEEDEGFVGSQIISLMRARDSVTLWATKVDGRQLGYPCVSDSGDVAIPRATIEVFDRSGRFIGSYDPRPRYRIYTPDCVWVGHAFASNSSSYYVLVCPARDLQDVWIYAFTRTMHFRWREQLGDFRYGRIEVYKDKIILDDFAFGYNDAFNRCIVLDDSGRVLRVDTVKCPPWIRRLTIDSVGVASAFSKWDSLRFNLDSLKAP